MLKKLSFLICFCFILFSNITYSAENLIISYVDIDKIISQSEVGKKINKSLEQTLKKKNKEFQKIEEELKKKENDIVKQKNILSPDELNKKIENLQNNIKDYRIKKDKFQKNITQKKLKATSELVGYLNKILAKYASENSISLIIQKKNIVIGKSEMDITNQIMKVFNKEVKDVKIN